MERITKELKDELQKTYWELAEAYAIDTIRKSGTARIIIDIQKGRINSVQNQQIVSGASLVNYEQDKYNILTNILESDNI